VLARLGIHATMIMVTPRTYVRQERCSVANVCRNRIVVLSSRPGSIHRIVPVPMPHPRERTEAGFNAIKHDVLGDFAEGAV